MREGIYRGTFLHLNNSLFLGTLNKVLLIVGFLQTS